MRDRTGRLVDEKIKPLVIGLQFCGIETKASCEGHYDYGSRYPWVDVSYRLTRKVAKLLAWQNRPKLPDGSDNNNVWVLRPSGVLRIIPENRDVLLEELQQRAIEFGNFLQNLPDNRFPKGWFNEEGLKCLVLSTEY